MAKNSCVDCESPESIPETEVLYSQGEPSPRRVRRYTRLPEPQTGYALYHCDENYQTGFYLLKPQAANNLVTNPTFYFDLDNWSQFNANVIRTNDTAFDSGFSLRINGSGDQVTAERREYAETIVTSFIAGQPYTFSAYIWMPQAWDVSDPYMGTISIADDLGNETFSSRVTKYGQWQRLSVTVVTDETALELYLRFNLRSQDQRENQPPYNLTGDYNLTNEFAYFDMAQLEYGTQATTPFHGNTDTCACSDGAYSWSGVPHKSASIRSKCAKDGGVLTCLSDLGFEISSHTGHGAPPIRDISFPLNNRAGEYYQKSVADARVLTLTGQLCETTLKDLECAIYELMGQMLPGLSPCSCCGQFLLVYKHGECDDSSCDVERDLALCVTYIGGLEGSRTNHYNQQASIQFKAHDPFWFEWPGHSSQALTYAKVVSTPNVLLVSSDGTARGIPVSSTNTYNTIVCRPGINSIAIGGDFTSIDGSPDRCEENVAVWDCDHWVDLCFGFAGDRINQLTADNEGNILVAGSFSGPCNNVGIIYEDGTTGCFPGYPGGEAYAIIAPFWAQIVVGDDSGIHIQGEDGDWFTFSTDGRVEGFALDSAGNLYIVGQFTTVDGVETGSVAFLNVNLSSCPDFEGGIIESLGYTFNGSVNSVDINRDTGTVYLGGAFTQATPLPVDICQVTNGTRIDSRGTDQILRFRQITVNDYEVDVLYTNIIARNLAQNCLTNGQYIRITGQSSVGTIYSFLFGTYNASVLNTGTEVIGTDTFYRVTYSVNTAVGPGEPCETLNTGLIDELDQSNADLSTYAVLDLPGGTGEDNTLSNLSAQCVTVTESYQGDSVDLNYVAKLTGTTISAMDEGLSSEVNVVAVDPTSGEVYAGTQNGLFIWNGLAWFDFAGITGGVNDLDFCDDGSLAILHNRNRSSVVADSTEVFYNGDVSPSYMNLIVHGPGKIQTFGECSGNHLDMCTVLECNEVATLNFNSGDFRSNYRNNLSPSILGGSRYDICLDKCLPNNMCLYISDDDAQTKATLIWREAYYGLEALCCSRSKSSLQTGGSQASPYTLECRVDQYLQMHRDPTDDDCRSTGISDGTLWFNAVSTCGLFISRGDCGTDCTEFEGSYIGEDGVSYTEPDGTVYCYDTNADCDTEPAP